MKNLIAFILIALSIVGFIGGIGYTIYCDAYFIAICIGVLGYIAYPKFKTLIESIIN